MATTTTSSYIRDAERRGMKFSLMMHALMLLIFIVGMPRFMPPPVIDEPAAITVDILPIGAVSNVRPSNSKPAKAKDKPKPKPAEIESKELEELKEEAVKPSPAVKAEESPPAPEEIVEEKDAKAEEKPKDKPKEKAKEEDPLDAILKGLEKQAQAKKPKSQTKKAESAAAKSGNRSNNFDPN